MPAHTYILLAALALPAVTLAQGPLTPPPGGPQPSMKTLHQVEPRTDLFNAPENLVATDNPDFYYEIKAPGSYYLSRNTSAGGLAIGATAKPNVILISADDVTLDLNGFQLRGAASNLPGAIAPDTAIDIDASNTHLLNGTIQGFRQGVLADGFARRENISLSDLRLIGCLRDPIYILGDNARITRCTAMGAPSQNANYGINVTGKAIISGCTVEVAGSGSLYGIYAFSQSVISGCTVRAAGGGRTVGISAPNASTLNNCTATVSSEETAIGIDAYVAATVTGCTVHISGPSSEDGEAIGIAAAAANIRHCATWGEPLGGIKSGRTGFQLTDASVTGCSAHYFGKGFVTDGGNLDNCLSTRNTIGFDSGSSSLSGCKSTGGSVGFATRGATDLHECSATGADEGSGFGFLVAGNRNRLINCQADRNNSNFVVTGDNNHLDACTAIATAINGGAGFVASGSNNTVVRCAAKNCSVNFALNASTKAGPVVANPIDATNPFSNFAN